MSTSRTCGKSSSTIWTLRWAIFWMRCRMSSPRRPRLRFMESAESATSCSSRRTNWGITSTPSRKPVSAMSAMRPSMMTLVSRIDVGNAAVDDDAGVQDFEGLLGHFLAAENAAQGGQVEHVALLGAHDQADVGHPKKQADLYEWNHVGGISTLRPRPAQHE